MGSSSSRLGSRPSRPRLNRTANRSVLSSLVCGGSSSRATYEVPLPLHHRRPPIFEFSFICTNLTARFDFYWVWMIWDLIIWSKCRCFLLLSCRNSFCNCKFKIRQACSCFNVIILVLFPQFDKLMQKIRPVIGNILVISVILTFCLSFICNCEYLCLLKTCSYHVVDGKLNLVNQVV
jgi:hypothetical protein